MKIIDLTGGASGKLGDKAKMKRISYFSDFIFMQQLMTLEIDIVLGHTKNSMKHLGKNTNDSDEDGDKKPKKKIPGVEDSKPIKKK